MRNVFTKLLQGLTTFVRHYVVTVSIIFTVALQAVAVPGESIQPPLSNDHIEIGLDPDQVKPILKIDVQNYEFESAEEAGQKVTNLISENSEKESDQLVFSSDESQLLKQVAEKTSTAHLTLVSVPKQSFKSQFLEVSKKFIQSRIDHANDDRFGLAVVTFTTSSEVFRWMHSTQLSHFEQTSNAIYTVVLGIVFGLNKDTWSQTAKPIQKFFRKFTKPETDNPNNLKEIAARFLGNLTLASALSSLRIPLVSMDQILDTGLQMHYFSMPLLLTLASTSAIFTWSEHIAMIDKDTHPLTKFIFRRVNESRSIILGMYAATAMLLNPSQYGWAPWWTLAAVGATGATFYANAKTITEWIETRPWLQSFKAKLEELNAKKKIKKLRLQCEALF